MWPPREAIAWGWSEHRGENTAAARAVCLRCSVRDECLAYAMAQGPAVVGVWGGTTGRQRRGLHAATRSAA